MLRAELTTLYESLLKFSSFFFSSLTLGIVRASPKSQILILQLESIKIFAGLRSRWTMLQECRKLIAQSILYSKVITCPSSIFVFGIDWNNFLKSLSQSSITIKMWSNSSNCTSMHESLPALPSLYFSQVSSSFDSSMLFIGVFHFESPSLILFGVFSWVEAWSYLDSV